MNGNPTLDLPDRQGVRRRIGEAARKLRPELHMDGYELSHLADVVTNHALLLNDLYATRRLDRIMGQDPSAIARGLADLIGPAEDLAAESVRHLRRIPDDVRIVGDKCLYDVGLFGLRRYKGLDLRQLGARCYILASEILAHLADDKRLRDYFKQNRMGPMPIEEEVIFLKQCGERFRSYTELLNSLKIFDPLKGSLSGGTIAAPEVEPDKATPPPSAPSMTPEPSEDEDEEIPADKDDVDETEFDDVWPENSNSTSLAPQEQLEVMPGAERLPRNDLLSLYERLVLVSNLQVPTLRKELNRVVVDQEVAVSALCDELSLYATGTQALSRPASFFLVGPTGVGKNHLVECFVKELEGLWGVEVPMLLLEGPQYTYPSDINELKGATRGFIRSDEEGILTEFYKRASVAPLSVILVDEVEKAHPQLRKFFLGLMDRGTTMDNRGEILYFANTLFFFTSNIGYSRLQTSTSPIGFGDSEAQEQFKRTEVDKDLKKILSPEFVNRLSVIRFGQLSRSSVEAIFDLEFSKVVTRYQEVQKIKLTVTKKARMEIIKQGFNPEFGARPLGRLINFACNVEVSKKIKRDEGRDGRETKHLLNYLREARDGKRALDPAMVERVMEEARAHTGYETLRIGWDGKSFTYTPIRRRS